jgi:hypothetical protein
VFTLSHWPGTPTPSPLKGDLSAEIVRDALRHGDLLPSAVEVASIDHYDVDGLVALALATTDDLDAAHGPLLVEAARVGDFDVVTDRRAALIAFALNGLYEGDRHCGLGLSTPEGSHGSLERCGSVALEALAIMFDLSSDPERFEALWRDECAAYDESVRALAQGWATVEERPELDLAVLRVDTKGDDAGGAAWKSAPLHPAAVHSATSCLRVVTVAGGRMELRYRYESWVRLTSARPRRRVDLERLAYDLTAAETGKSRWVFDGAGAITGALHLAGDHSTSTIDPGRFVEWVCRQLATLDEGPGAWDPYSSPAA